MDRATAALKEKLDRLLEEAAEVSVALDRADGTISGVPHYSMIEARAHELGQQLSREIQARQMGELSRGGWPQPPARNAEPVVNSASRDARSPRSTVLSKSRSCKRIARPVAGPFSPDREALGFDARELTPLLIQRMTFAAAETRSFERAGLVMKNVGNQPVSAKTIERVVHDVGWELAERRDADPKTADALAQRPESPPDLAVVKCDGGRIRTREPGHGPGVHRTTEGWRETKNACLIRAQRKTFGHDPQPEPPECFCDPKHVAKIAETEALSVAAPRPASSREVTVDESLDTALPLDGADWRPKRLVRTVLSSLAASKDFGKQMAREAKRRRFFEAMARAFLGDGLPWNWSIWKAHFPNFTPILDFIHVLSYLFVVAKAVHQNPEEAWSQYVVWMRGCWQGEVAQALEELRHWQARVGEPPKEASDNDPRSIVATTITYLENNRERMRYPEYRRQGLPVTTAWMESLVKEVNYRVKGTEIFWNDPEGAEAILQVRAAALCDDERLVKHLRNRPGHPFTRRPKIRKVTTEKNKS